MKHKRLPWSDLIDENGKWEKGFDPYMLCQGINGGDCPLYEAKNGAG